MLSVLSVLLLLSVPPAASPTPAADIVPLRKIGSTSTKVLCGRIVEHANLAIGNALDNDQSLARITLRLQTTNFDNLNSMQQRNTIDELDKQAGNVRYASAAALQAAGDLRAAAAVATDDEQRDDIKAFADAIAGAVARQRKEASDFQTAVTILNGRMDTAEIEGVRRQAARMAAPVVDPRMEAAANAPSLLEQPPKHLNDYWRPVAADFEERAAYVRSDEGVASRHSIGAVKGC